MLRYVTHETSPDFINLGGDKRDLSMKKPRPGNYLAMSFACTLCLLSGCNEKVETEDLTVVNEEYAAKSESKKKPPPKFQNEPCSPYNLAFYKSDVRHLTRRHLRIGMESSDATIDFGGQDITILGFTGQAETYYDYYVYHGTREDTRVNKKGAEVTKTVKTKLTVCFKTKLIAIYRYSNNAISRGKFTKNDERYEYFSYQL